jgi:hypothetical protein
VRAAAAWAAAGRRSSARVAAALGRAREGASARVAANAAAALDAQVSAGEPRFARVRMRTADGAAVAGRWVRVRAGKLAVWTRTDAGGEARVQGLPPGPYEVALEEADLVPPRP